MHEIEFYELNIVCPFMNSLLPFFQGHFCYHFVKFERTRLPWVMLAKLVEVLVGCCIIGIGICASFKQQWTTSLGTACVSWYKGTRFLFGPLGGNIERITPKTKSVSFQQ